jgi:hypothetical protein
MKKSKFPYILGFAAFATAAVAAWFSVTGLGKLFAGAAVSVMIMAGVLEFSKLVVASYVYRYWKKINFLAKTYLIIALVILMTITSAGIYGYLSGAYSETSSKLQISNGEISLLDKKKEQFTGRIKNTEENINKKNTRITSLNNLRASQEVRLDSLYARKYYRQAKVVETQIKDADSEIKKLTKETDSLLNVVNGYNEEISKLDLDVTGKEADNLKGDTAPLQYIASLFSTNMDKVVNFFMFLLIFVCDPLAIMLVIATNKVLLESNSEEEKVTVPEVIKNIEPEPIQEPVKKVEEVVSYVANDKGEFKPVKKEEPKIDLALKIILDDIRSQDIGHNASYLSFLDVLFKEGEVKVGDLMLIWDVFIEQLDKKGLKYTEKEVKDFLTICNLFKITDMSGPDKMIAKDYSISKDIISLLSK